LSDTQEAGAWEALVGMVAWRDATDIWGHLTTAQKEALIRAHAVVYACVNKIMVAFADAPPVVGRTTEDGFEPTPDHPLQEILYNPNPNMSWEEFARPFVGNLMLSGESPVWEWRDEGKYIQWLYPIPKSWLRVLRDRQTGQVIGYEISQYGKRVKVPISDITIPYFVDPTNPTQGLAPLDATLRAVQTDQERESYMMEMVHNLKVPTLVLKQNEGWDSEQKKEARQLITELVGRGKRGDALFVGGEGAEVTALAPLKDIDWPGLANLSETRICAAFGVPPITIHLRSGLDKATYSNYEQAERAFYGDTMQAIWNYCAAALTRGLIEKEAQITPEWEGVEIRFDTSDITQLHEDRVQAADRGSKLFNGGLITRDEAREIAGQEPLGYPLGTVLLQPVTMLEIQTEGSQRPQDQEQKKIDHRHFRAIGYDGDPDKETNTKTG
jgi:HK97 family phage portal protein